MIKDSGSRTEFTTGAVRDLREGKGRMDLTPLDIISKLVKSDVLKSIDKYTHTGEDRYLYKAIKQYCTERNWDIFTGAIEVSKQYEEGCKKYGDFNWQKGIPIHCYIDSACRHYIKWRRGDNDEPHDRATIWNLLGAIWTAKHKPEMQDLQTISKN